MYMSSLYEYTIYWVFVLKIQTLVSLTNTDLAAPFYSNIPYISHPRSPFQCLYSSQETRGQYWFCLPTVQPIHTPSGDAHTRQNIVKAQDERRNGTDSIWERWLVNRKLLCLKLQLLGCQIILSHCMLPNHTSVPCGSTVILTRIKLLKLNK